MLLTSLFILAATAITSTLADATPVINDLTKTIQPLVIEWGNDLKAFPGSGVNGSMTIDYDADNLSTALDTASSDAQSVDTFSQADSSSVVTALNSTTSSLEDVLKDFASKVSDFDAIGRASFVLANLQILNIRCSEYNNILAGKAPAGQGANFSAIKKRLEAAFNTSIEAYNAVA